jgi:hypothetical protein
MVSRNTELISDLMNKFLEEILEQPAVVQSIADFYLSPAGEDLLIKAKKIITDNRIEQIICAGMVNSSIITSHCLIVKLCLFVLHNQGRVSK